MTKALAITIILLLAALGYQWGRGEHARAELATVRADIDRQIREAESAARATETRRIQRLKEAQDAEFIARQDAQRDAAAARAAAERLRQQALRVAATSCAASDSVIAVGGPPAQDGPNLLADVLGSLAERADRLAEQADAARIAGRLCERAYDSLKELP